MGENSLINTDTITLINGACENLEEYCSEGDYIWNTYSVSDTTQCSSTYSCVYQFYSNESNCQNNLETGFRCLEELNSSDGCTHCDSLFQNLPKECEYPEGCFGDE